MPIEWNKVLESGLAWQDRQHKELFKRINSLLDAMSRGTGREETLKLLKFLDAYFVTHFDAEERAMYKCKFPGELVHISLHAKFIDEIANLKVEFDKGVSNELMMKIKSKVIDWLIDHIGGIDKELGRFIIRAERNGKT